MTYYMPLPLAPRLIGEILGAMQACIAFVPGATSLRLLAISFI